MRALQEKYGGHLRYFMWRRAQAPATPERATPPGAGAGAAPDPGEGAWIAADDTAAQLQALAEGRLGVGWRLGKDGRRELWYARP